MPACSAKSLSFSMAQTSQIANSDARPLFRSLRRACDSGAAHIANMETTKNGGVNHLSAWRLHAGLTVEKLAELVGTSPGQISDLENGKRGLSLKWLRRLAPLLNTTPGNLADYHPSELKAQVIDIFEAIEERDRMQARRVLESFRATS
jgi:transcriptional regulator with XRE-family HTH domain